jgi:undecaprenyl diphosphate synthase
MKLKHLLMILDGHRRYAREHNIHLAKSYQKTTEQIPQLVRATFDQGVDILTIYAVSLYNLSRPKKEIEPLNAVISSSLDTWLQEPCFEGISFNFIGELSNLDGLNPKISKVESHYKGSKLLNILLAYSGDLERQRAINKCIGLGLPTTKGNLLHHHKPNQPIDLLIRTAGVLRLSDGPLVGIAQSKMYPIETKAPELKPEELIKIISDYQEGKII